LANSQTRTYTKAVKNEKSITIHLKFRNVTAQDGSQDVSTCKDTTKM